LFVLLVGKYDGNKEGFFDGFGMWNYSALAVAENDEPQGDYLGSTGGARLGELARSTGKEVPISEEARRVAGEGIGACGLVCVLDELAQEGRRQGFLLVGCWVEVVEGTEERSRGGKQLVAVRDVQGALFEIAPKRRSQEACGFADRVCNHWASTLAKKDS
jgi:hypothetical protein